MEKAEKSPKTNPVGVVSFLFRRRENQWPDFQG